MSWLKLNDLSSHQRDGAFVKYVIVWQWGTRKGSNGICARLASLLIISTVIGIHSSGSALSQEQTASPTVLGTITINGDGESPVGPDNSVVAKRSKAASKTNTSLLETPQAVSVVTRQQMDDQGADTVPQALRYTPEFSLKQTVTTYDMTGFISVATTPMAQFGWTALRFRGSEQLCNAERESLRARKN